MLVSSKSFWAFLIQCASVNLNVFTNSFTLSIFSEQYFTASNQIRILDGAFRKTAFRVPMRLSKSGKHERTFNATLFMPCARHVTCRRLGYVSLRFFTAFVSQRPGRIKSTKSVFQKLYLDAHEKDYTDCICSYIDGK